MWCVWVWVLVHALYSYHVSVIVLRRMFSPLLFSRLEWKNYEVVVSARKTINVRNVMNDAKEKLDFRDRIIKASIAHKHLVVATSSQCYIYK